MREQLDNLKKSIKFIYQEGRRKSRNILRVWLHTKRELNIRKKKQRNYWIKRWSFGREFGAVWIRDNKEVFLICKGQCDLSSFFLSFNLFPFSWYDRLIAWETDGLSESLFFVHVSLYTRLYVVFFGRKSSLDFVRDFILKVRNALSVSLINLSKPSSTTLVNFQIAIRMFLWMFTFGIFCSYRIRIYIDIQWKF